jgi:mannose-6-phosphate isomerase-like protein (cupin superfamily)
MHANYGDNYGQENVNRGLARDNYGQASYGNAQDNYGYGSYYAQDNYGNANCPQDNHPQDNYPQDNYPQDNYGNAPYGQNSPQENAGYGNAGMGYDRKPGGKKKQGDYGPQPFVVNINSAARHNGFYRTTLWTGQYLQLTLMSITDEIGLEVHPDTDQFIRIEEGWGLVMMGDSPDNLTFRLSVGKNSAIFVPAGTWHNLVNCGPVPIRLYTIYAPPHHKPGTIHPTRKDAMEDEH